MLNRPPLVAFSARYECFSNPAAETSRLRSQRASRGLGRDPRVRQEKQPIETSAGWAMIRLLRGDSRSRPTRSSATRRPWRG
jgi:hypothetical protein